MIINTKLIKYSLLALISMAFTASFAEEFVYANKKNTKIYKDSKRGSRVLERVSYGAAFTIVSKDKDWVRISFGNNDYGYIRSDDIYYYNPADYSRYDNYNGYYNGYNNRGNRGQNHHHNQGSVEQMREAQRQTEFLMQQQHQLRPVFDYEKGRR